MSDSPQPDSTAPPSEFIEPPPAAAPQDYIEPPAAPTPQKPLDPQTKARAAGYSWPEIDDHIARATQVALANGYDQQDIDRHLGYSDPDSFIGRARDVWTARMASDPSIIDKLAGPQPELDIAGPDAAQAYASALQNREVKGPQDFAEHYAAAALDAAHNVIGLEPGDDQAIRAKKLAGAVAADNLAAQLPGARDVTDAALAVAPPPAPLPTTGLVAPGNIDLAARPIVRNADGSYSTVRSMSFEEDGKEVLVPTVAADGSRILSDDEAIAQYKRTGQFLGKFDTPDHADAYAQALHEQQASQYGAAAQHDQAKQNLMDNWLGTGEHPLDAAAKAGTDPVLADKLTQGPPLPSYPAEVWRGAVNAVSSFLLPAAETAARADVWLGEHLPGAMGEAYTEQAKSDLASVVAAQAKNAIEYASNASFADAPLHQAAYTVGGVVPTVAGYLISPWGMVALGANQGAVQAGKANNGDVAAIATGAVVGAAEAGAPIPFLKGAFGGSMLQAVTRGALGMSLVSVASALANRLPELAADGTYKWPSLAELGESAAGGAISGGLFGAAGRLMTPRVQVADIAKPPGEMLSEMPLGDVAKPPEPAKLAEAPEGEAVAAAQPKSEFVPEATPAEKMQALSDRSSESMPADRTNAFQDLAKNEDAATQKLAQGYDAASGIGGWLKVNFPTLAALLKDESGLGPLSAENLSQSAARKIPFTRQNQEFITMKDAAEGLIRKFVNGRPDAKTRELAQQLEGLYPLVSPHIPEFKAELEKPGGGDWRNTALGYLYRASEGEIALDPNHPLTQAVKQLADINAAGRHLMEEAVSRGDIDKAQFLDWYLPHLYENADQMGARGGGHEGNLRMMQHRTIPTWSEALDAGYKPKFDNPLAMQFAVSSALYKGLGTREKLNIAKQNNWAVWGSEPGFERLDGVGTRRSFVDAEGRVRDEYLYAHPGFAEIWNNHVALESWATRQKPGGWEDTLLKTKNLSTQAKLALPLYHVVTMYKEAWTSAWGSAEAEMGHFLHSGDFTSLARAAMDFTKGPVALPLYVVNGRRLRQMTNEGRLDPALEGLRDVGFTVQTKRPDIYDVGRTPTILQSWRRGTLGQELKADLQNPLTFPFRELGRVVTTVQAPVWDHLIPLVKAGAAYERARMFLRDNPGADDAMVSTRMRQIADNVEDRFGEYNMKNLFWNPILHRVANQAALSTGWTYGTVHFTAAGAGWRLGRGMQWDPVAFTNLTAMFAQVAATNALWSLAVDGKVPSDLLDYLIPFANARGIARVLLPGQEKEYWDWMKVVNESLSVAHDQGGWAGARSFMGGTAGYITGKLAPIYSTAAAWLLGEDKIGHKLDYQPGGPLAFLENAFMPIFVANWDKAQAIGVSAAANMFGVREAPKWAENWDLWRAQQEKLHAGWTRDELRRATREAATLGLPAPEGATGGSSQSVGNFGGAVGGTIGTNRGVGRGRSEGGGGSAPGTTREEMGNLLRGGGGAVGTGASRSSSRITREDMGNLLRPGTRSAAPNIVTPGEVSPAQLHAIRRSYYYRRHAQ